MADSRDTPHLRLVPPLPPPRRLTILLPPGMTEETWHATLDGILGEIHELQALTAEMQAKNSEMRANNDRMLTTLRHSEDEA